MPGTMTSETVFLPLCACQTLPAAKYANAPLPIVLLSTSLFESRYSVLEIQDYLKLVDYCILLRMTSPDKAIDLNLK